MVIRLFATNTARFARGLQKDGPQATAIGSCIRVFNVYGWGFFVLGFVLALAGASSAMGICFAVGGGFILYSLARLPWVWGAARRFRAGTMQG
jgi:hypothetical protein